MVDLGWLGYRTANVCIRTLELSSITIGLPAARLVIEHLSHAHYRTIHIQSTRGVFRSLRAHSFQPSPLNEDSYRLWLNFKTRPYSRRLPPLELQLMLSPPYCLSSPANSRPGKICIPEGGRGYSILKNYYLNHFDFHRCSCARVWSSNWCRRLAGIGDLPRRAKIVHVSPTGGIVTYVTEEEIVVRYYT